MTHDDFQREPVRGLPEALPPGERILWQGAPDWRALAWRAFGLRLVLLWFAAMAAWGVSTGLGEGRGLAESLVALVPQAAMALVAALLLGTIAWATARATVYTVTNRRVAMRINLALTVTLNIPFARIAAASLATAGRTGDVALELSGSDRFAWFLLWPHARPWRLRNPQPALRAVPEPQAVAALLAEAVTADATHRGAAVVPARRADAPLHGAAVAAAG